MKIISGDDATEFALFGMVLLQWGHIEAELVSILLRLSHPLFGFFDKKGLPPAFSGQIRTAKRLYRDIPQMAELRDEACVLLDTLHPLHRTRSIIVHGYYQGYTGRDRFMFGIFERDEAPKMVNKAYYFTQAEIMRLSSDIEESRVKMGALSADTFRAPLPKAIRST